MGFRQLEKRIVGTAGRRQWPKPYLYILAINWASVRQTLWTGRLLIILVQYRAVIGLLITSD